MHAHFDHSLLHTRLNVETINKIHMSGDRSVPFLRPKAGGRRRQAKNLS